MMQTLTAPSAIDVGECSECAPADGIGAAAEKAGPRHVPAGRSKTNYSIWLFVWKGRSVMDKIVAGSSELGTRKNGHGRNVMSRWNIPAATMALAAAAQRDGVD